MALLVVITVVLIDICANYCYNISVISHPTWKATPVNSTSIPTTDQRVQRTTLLFVSAGLLAVLGFIFTMMSVDRGEAGMLFSWLALFTLCASIVFVALAIGNLTRTRVRKSQRIKLVPTGSRVLAHLPHTGPVRTTARR